MSSKCVQGRAWIDLICMMKNSSTRNCGGELKLDIQCFLATSFIFLSPLIFYFC
jgi:hypothetical protein